MFALRAIKAAPALAQKIGEKSHRYTDEALKFILLRIYYAWIDWLEHSIPVSD